MRDPVAIPIGEPRTGRSRSRSAIAAARVGRAREALSRCHLCAHRCGVNRLAGNRGPCRAGTTARVFHSQVEAGDEAELTPVFAVAFSGCDLRCDFCITGRQSWDPGAGTPLDDTGGDGSPIRHLAERARRALAGGTRSVMLLGGEPTIHLPTTLDFASRMPDDATLVWKTNAHATAEARELLDGVFDVWVADYKFGNDDCALRLARVPGYTAVVRENLRWARTYSDLIVRHLLMPGHVDCCWLPIATWLAGELPGVKVSLRDGFWPGWHSDRHPGLSAPLSIREGDRARGIASNLGLNLVP